MRTIDADAALKALRKCQTYLYDARDPELKIELSSAEAAINNLPTIQPEPHEGIWVYGEDSTADCVDGYRCSQCGFFVPWDYNHKLIDYINDYAYCPHCGAKMIAK